MFEEVKSWLERIDKKLDLRLDLMDGKLLRPIACQLDLEKEGDDGKEVTEKERKDYCASISAVYPRLEKDIKKFLYEQMERIAIKPLTWEESLVLRGEYSGMAFLLDFWGKAHLEHLKGLRPEEFDKDKVFPEIE